VVGVGSAGSVEQHGATTELRVAPLGLDEDWSFQSMMGCPRWRKVGDATLLRRAGRRLASWLGALTRR
jgi:hypothetical protein